MCWLSIPDCPQPNTRVDWPSLIVHSQTHVLTDHPWLSTAKHTCWLTIPGGPQPNTRVDWPSLIVPSQTHVLTDHPWLSYLSQFGTLKQPLRTTSTWQWPPSDYVITLAVFSCWEHKPSAIAPHPCQVYAFYSISNPSIFHSRCLHQVFLGLPLVYLRVWTV